MKPETIARTLTGLQNVINTKGQPLFYSERGYALHTQFVYGTFLFVDSDHSGRLIDIEEVIRLIETGDPVLAELKIGVGSAKITQHVFHGEEHYFRGQICNFQEASVTKRIQSKLLINDYSSKTPFSWLMKKDKTFAELYDIEYIVYLLMKYPVLKTHCLDMTLYQLQRLLKQKDEAMNRLHQQLLDTTINTATLQ